MLPEYAHQRLLTISAPMDAGLPAGTVVRVFVETKTLQGEGLCRPDRRDFRVVYNGTTEIHRVMLSTGEAAFRLQADIPAGATSAAYALNFGNPTESTEPLQDPGHVWPFHVDGDDIAAMSSTGDAAAVDVPRPGFLKFGLNPTLVRRPGQGDFKNIREVELFYEDGTFWATYDADDNGVYDGHVGWTSYLASSPDLINWTYHGEVLAPGVAGDGRQDRGSASDLIIHKFDGYPGYYGTYLGTNNLVSGVPSTPYVLHGATAPAPAGPWTKTGILLPLGEGTSFDSLYNVDAVIFHRDADPAATFYMVYGACTAGPPTAWTTALARSTTGPMGPWTKLGVILTGASGNQGVENPRIVDDGSGNFYLLNNLIDFTGLGAVTRSNVIYWSSQFDAYPATQRTSIIEPGDQGAWDEWAVGVVSTPVMKDGMMYVGYDGGNFADWSLPDSVTHKYRDGGFAEAPWPFPWAKAVRVGTGTAQTGTALAVSDTGRLRVRARLDIASQGFGLVGATESFRVQSADETDEWGDPVRNFFLTVNGVNAAMVTQVSNFGHTKTWSFQRSAETLTIYCQGYPVWSGPSAEDLSVRLYGEATLEEAWVEPVTPYAGVADYEATHPTDTTWEVLVPVSEAPGTFDAVASTGETASVEVVPPVTGQHILQATGIDATDTVPVLEQIATAGAAQATAFSSTSVRIGSAPAAAARSSEVAGVAVVTGVSVIAASSSAALAVAVLPPPAASVAAMSAASSIAAAATATGASTAAQTQTRYTSTTAAATGASTAAQAQSRNASISATAIGPKTAATSSALANASTSVLTTQESQTHLLRATGNDGYATVSVREQAGTVHVLRATGADGYATVSVLEQEPTTKASAAAVSAVGAISAIAAGQFRDPGDSTTVSGGAAVAATGHLGYLSLAELRGTGVSTATGVAVLGASAVAGIVGTGVLSATGESYSGPAHSGTAANAAVGDIQGEGHRGAQGTPALHATPLLQGAGHKEIQASAALSAVGRLTADNTVSPVQPPIFSILLTKSLFVCEKPPMT